MKNYTKARIRLNKVQARLNKTTYKYLKPEEYKLIKIIERLEQLGKDKDKFWRYNVTRDADNKAVASEESWSLFHYLDKEWRSFSCKMSRLQEKHSWSDNDILNIQGLHNRDNMNTTSY